MASSELRATCPGAEPLGPARLDDHRLAFLRRSRRWGAGAADVTEDPGHSVWGVLYELPDTELPALDVREGAGLAYRRFEVSLRLGDELRSAFAYRTLAPEPAELAPDPRYVDLMLSGAREHRLPADYVSSITSRLRHPG
jgi:gamma-glutamylcyclotransferase (GGCT)/AIG2-like uncharacterized protein YtfP